MSIVINCITDYFHESVQVACFTLQTSITLTSNNKRVKENVHLLNKRLLRYSFRLIDLVAQDQQGNPRKWRLVQQVVKLVLRNGNIVLVCCVHDVPVNFIKSVIHSPPRFGSIFQSSSHRRLAMQMHFKLFQNEEHVLKVENSLYSFTVGLLLSKIRSKLKHAKILGSI